MKCSDFRERLNESWGGEIPPDILQHVAGCPACAEYLRGGKVVRFGFRALAAQVVPEPSLGFAARLVRRLGESAEEAAQEEFFAKVGRRFVYATLMLTLALLMALALPSTGPVRGSTTADLMLAQPEVTAGRNDSLVGAETTDTQETAPAAPSGQGQKGQE